MKILCNGKFNNIFDCIIVCKDLDCFKVEKSAE